MGDYIVQVDRIGQSTPAVWEPARRVAARLAMALLLMLGGCASGGQPQRSETAAAAVAPRSSTLRMSIVADAEPKEALPYGRGAGGSEPVFVLHAALTAFDDRGAVQPRLAQRVPTIENGDWSVSADGTMDVTWRLRSDALWHDGTPLTAGDIVLGFRVSTDPELPFPLPPVLGQVRDVTAPDAHTVIVHWKTTFIFANEMGLDALSPLPQHLLGSLYTSGDKQAMATSPRFTDQWVGLGPYKMSHWSRGSFIDATANEQYFLGKPKIDRVIIRYIGDTNTIVVGLMAGDVDALSVGSLKDGEAATLRAQWESAGAGTVFVSPVRMDLGKWQFRDSSAPWAGDVRVRQALTKLIDRQGIADTILGGIPFVEDITLPRNDPAYGLAKERGLPNLSYDVAQGHRLLMEVGLTRSPDGTYRTRSGEPFAIEFSSAAEIESRVKQALAVTDSWTRAGLAATTSLIPVQYTTNQKNETRAKVQGIVYTAADLSYTSLQGYLTSEISTDATRWRGTNQGGYSNPLYDQLYARLVSTLNSGDRNQIAADLVKLSLDQMVYLPLAYSNDVSASAKNVRGMTNVVVTQRANSWNIHQWEMS